MADKIFADGIYFELPRQGAPEYVLGSISIKADKLIPFLQKHVNVGGYVNINIKTAKTTGNPYCELNVYEKKDAPVNKTSDTFQGRERAEDNDMREAASDRHHVATDSIEYPEDDINADDIPF